MRAEDDVVLRFLAAIARTALRHPLDKSIGQLTDVSVSARRRVDRPGSDAVVPVVMGFVAVVDWCEARA